MRLPLGLGRLARGAPDPRLALERYQRLAAAYDRRTLAGAPYRRRTVEALAPAPGMTVLDVGCGTGLNFALLEQGIGPRGWLIGVDLSPEMLALAEARVQRQGWANVVLLEAPAEDAPIPATADAALLCGVHDVMRSRPALSNVLRHVRSGGRLVAGGPKWVAWWRPHAAAMNATTWAMNRDYVTTFDGFDRPWRELDALVPDLTVEEVYFNAGYIARGTRP
jgi:SAM-dependent methyltransferase